MIKLETNYQNSDAFYFRTLDDCNKFLYVFKDHWCNVKWKSPVEVSDNISLSRFQRYALDKDPKDRAQSNLSWGFNLARRHDDDKLNREQQIYLNRLMEEL